MHARGEQESRAQSSRGATQCGAGARGYQQCTIRNTHTAEWRRGPHKCARGTACEK